VEKEILVTRDSRPVGRLVLATPPAARRTRWNPDAHVARIRKILGRRVFPSVDAQLAADRDDRKL
jgi:hypothetical protein